MRSYLKAPVYRSFLKPKLLFGLPRTLAVLLFSGTALAVLIFNQPWTILLTGLLTFVSAKLTKIDPFFFDMFISLMQLPDEDLD